MAMTAFTHPVESSERAKIFLACLLAEEMDKLDLESLLNLSLLISTFKLDEINTSSSEQQETLTT